jgi:hypothetical protein
MSFVPAQICPFTPSHLVRLTYICLHRSRVGTRIVTDRHLGDNVDAEIRRPTK